MSDVGVVIVTWNSASTIADCLASLPPEMTVVVVDNASGDDTVRRVRKTRPQTTIIESERNRGFGSACNLGAASLPGLDLLLLNPDATIEASAIQHLRQQLEEAPSLGAMGPAIADASGTLELSWGSDPSLKNEWDRKQAHSKQGTRHQEPMKVDWVTGGCCLIRRDAWEEVGGFDEHYFLYFEDLDLCRRIRRAGYEVRYDPRISALHLRGVSAGKLGHEVEFHYRHSQIYYYQKYASPREILGLRLYLMLKFMRKSLQQPEGRETYKAIVTMAFKGSSTGGVHG